ncbi:MAG TPA: PIN domain-containing protein [Candidatus Nanopelagicaceae bacterium]|nr:PIN domain-containing protein [Candidatus Nanopelagicaceae bacterium]
MAFSAFLDACALVPSRGRDVLLQVATGGVFRPLWSSEILRELDSTIRKFDQSRGAESEETDAYLRRLNQQMERSFPDAMVMGWEQIESTIELPDPNDRHVVAAALIGRADVIVTDNTRDFPADKLPRPLFTQTVDEFLLDSLDLYPSRVCEAIIKVAERTGRNGPRQSSTEVAEYLRRTSAPVFGVAVALLLD